MQAARFQPHSANDDDSLSEISASRLLRPPPARQWMVERCFTRGTVGLLSGDGGIGKSLACQQLLTAACLGLPWFGLRCEPGRGYFFACEDDGDELHRRQAAICEACGRAMDDVIDGGLYLAERMGRDNALARLDRKSWRMEPTLLCKWLFERCLRYGCSYLVIDTATQTFAGNQNDEQQVVQFINILRRIAIAIQGVVLLTKHPSMSGRALGTGESGNTAWSNSVRSRLYLHRDKTQGLILDMKKANYGPSDLQIPLEWRAGTFQPIGFTMEDYRSRYGD